jgi:hypothetical protein
MATTSASAGLSLVGQATSARWAGRATTDRSTIYWLPRQDVPVLRPDGTFNLEWWRFFAEVSRRLAGVKGPSLTDIQSTTDALQQSVIDAQNTAIAAHAAAESAEYRIDIVRDVAIRNGLSGAGNIP